MGKGQSQDAAVRLHPRLLWELGHVASSDLCDAAGVDPRNPMGQPDGNPMGTLLGQGEEFACVPGRLSRAPKVHGIWHRPAGLASPAQFRIVL